MGSARDKTDATQQRLLDYALGLGYDALTPRAAHEAKVRVIDTLAALAGGFDGEACVIARRMAARTPDPEGATVVGTAMKTAPDMAAFANATAARYVELNDVYHWPGSAGGHPSDVVMPLLGVAEHARAGGRDLITAVVLAYEIYLRLSDAIGRTHFDCANFACIGVAAASARLLGLSRARAGHALSMAAVPNNILRRVRTGHLSMWKAVTAGHAGKAGVFAALLAREGMDGPPQPFEGRSGWSEHVAGKRFALDVMGGSGVRFKVEDTLIKPRSSCATTISSILAAEKVAPLLRNRIADVERVTVETYGRAKAGMGTGEHHWNPDSRETADHSIPYVVAAALIDGTVTPRQFDEAHLRDPGLRALLAKIEVVANDGFTRAYEKVPVEHHTRVSVVTRGGERFTGEAGGEKGDLAQPKSDAQIGEKFLGTAEPFLGPQRAEAMLQRLWRLDRLESVAEIPGGFTRI
ncbi:MAG: MmgE/PrpD family protein [Betaproteobacteria bacterium]|nr:MmgE/PrpD family protein [Betaproteobacteria bacterium]